MRPCLTETKWQTRGLWLSEQSSHLARTAPRFRPQQHISQMGNTLDQLRMTASYRARPCLKKETEDWGCSSVSRVLAFCAGSPGFQA